MKTILLYGDSNVWGCISHTIDLERYTAKRFPLEQRVGGYLAKQFNHTVQVIEEGLPGRTLSMLDENRPELCGKSYLKPCMLSHRPLDTVIIMLGTNDAKSLYQVSPEQMMGQLIDCVHIIETNYAGINDQVPHIVLIAPPTIAKQAQVAFGELFVGAQNKLTKYTQLIKQYAMQHQHLFVDASVIIPEHDTDGLHLGTKNHQDLADLIINSIKEHHYA